jgi:hypothetical protein
MLSKGVQAAMDVGLSDLWLRLKGSIRRPFTIRPKRKAEMTGLVSVFDKLILVFTAVASFQPVRTVANGLRGIWKFWNVRDTELQ